MIWKIAIFCGVVACLLLLGAVAGCGSSSVTCNSVESTGDAIGCTFTRSACSDGHTYQVHCVNAGSTCTCSVDGASSDTFPLTTFCGLGSSAAQGSAANTGCGWNLR